MATPKLEPLDADDLRTIAAGTVIFVGSLLTAALLRKLVPTAPPSPPRQQTRPEPHPQEDT